MSINLAFSILDHWLTSSLLHFFSGYALYMKDASSEQCDATYILFLKLSIQLHFANCFTTTTFFLTLLSLVFNAYSKSSQKHSWNHQCPGEVSTDTNTEATTCWKSGGETVVVSGTELWNFIMHVPACYTSRKINTLFLTKL